MNKLIIEKNSETWDGLFILNMVVMGISIFLAFGSGNPLFFIFPFPVIGVTLILALVSEMSCNKTVTKEKEQ